MMNEQKSKDLAAEFSKGIKTEYDLNQFTRLLTKLTIETALNAELTAHLGHKKNASKNGSNARNGYRQTHIQLCIIHMLRNSLKYVSWKDYKAVTQDLKAVYQSPTEEAALMTLGQFAQTWNDKYPQISKS